MTPISSIELSQLRRNAKRAARAQNIAYSQALDLEAKTKGFANWSLLMKHQEAPAEPSQAVTAARGASMAAVRQMLGMPRLDATRDERRTIMAIVSRYTKLVGEHIPVEPLAAMMDIEAVHCNGCPVDLVALLEAARDDDLVHDVAGMQRFVNRETGALEQGFTPRYSLMTPAVAG